MIKDDVAAQAAFITRNADTVHKVFVRQRVEVETVDETCAGDRFDQEFVDLASVEELVMSLVVEEQAFRGQCHDAAWANDADHLFHRATGRTVAAKMLNGGQAPGEIEAVVGMGEIGPVFAGERDLREIDARRTGRLAELEEFEAGFLAVAVT